MNQYNQIKRLLLIGIPLLCILLVAMFAQNRTASRENVAVAELAVSLDSGFYSEEQKITVDVPQSATVYYTDDCTEPGMDNGKLYEDPISLPVTDEEMVYVYRFKAYYEDGTASETANRTYFCGSSIDSRFTTNVLHITGEPEGLFGYESGIFVTGREFDEYLEANPGISYVNGVEANFTRRGDEYEREVSMEYFTKDGEILLSQDCGIRIYGAMSRMKNQKSFRLYARKEYDEQNEFKYPVLNRLMSAVDGSLAEEHKRLILRNSGNDNGFGFIRSELTARLAEEAGFPDVMQAEPVCVYINGMYYGIYWLENGFDDQYFVNRYGEHEGSFVVLEGGDKDKLEDEDSYVQGYVEEYNELYAKFAAMDLTVEENYQELLKVLDVENYLQYFAIENYVGNVDWPENNVRVYRYVSPDKEYEEGTVYDGRYRHMLFDVDYAFGLMLYNGTIGTKPEDATLHVLLCEDVPLFYALMQREDCRDYFTRYTLDLINGAMSYDHVEETLNEMHASRREELYHMLEETDLMENSLWNWETEVSMNYENVEKNYQGILDYAELHPGTVMTDMTLSFAYDFAKWYTLNVYKCGMSDLKVNTILLEEDAFTGVYFGDIPVDITPIMDVNEVFDYWLVNGEIREEEELSLTAEDIMDGQINVEMVVHATDNPVLQINAIRSKGQNDYIEVINLSDKEINTKGYYLSDREDAYRYDLPTEVLQPGQTRKYYGWDCMDTEALGQYGMNFNIKTGEIITLTYGKETIESVKIPDLMENGIYQRDGTPGKFIEILMEGE